MPLPRLLTLPALVALAVTASPAWAENAICQSLTPSHPAWGLYSCGTAGAEEQAEVTDSLDSLHTKLDALDAKLTGVGADVDDLTSLAEMIAMALADLETEVEMVEFDLERYFDTNSFENETSIDLYTAPAGRTLLATCRYRYKGDPDTILLLEAGTGSFGAGYQTILQFDTSEVKESRVTTVAKILRIANITNEDADSGFFLAGCTGILIPST